MPTQRDSAEGLPVPLEAPTYSSCPPESVDRPAQWRQQVLGDIEHAMADISLPALEVSSPQSVVLTEAAGASPTTEVTEATGSPSILASADLTSPGGPIQSPTPDQRGATPDSERTQASKTNSLALPYSTRYNVMSPRCIHSFDSSKLRPGSRYRGTQTSDQQRYKVEVDIKTVDMAESFICGYLKIEGLTPEHATLTTYFEGEIIGTKYTFQTRHGDWGASEKDDMKHWGQFSAWRPLAKQAKRPGFSLASRDKSDTIFMRWKEKFLVPDHKVKEISGASFEGFYYICFNRLAGSISGIYYHSKNDQHHSNKMQNLELEWVPDKGCMAAFEFR